MALSSRSASLNQLIQDQSGSSIPEVPRASVEGAPDADVASPSGIVQSLKSGSFLNMSKTPNSPAANAAKKSEVKKPNPKGNALKTASAVKAVASALAPAEIGGLGAGTGVTNLASLAAPEAFAGGTVAAGTSLTAGSAPVVSTVVGELGAAAGAAGATGGVAGGGSILGLLGLCHAAAEYYPLYSPDWQSTRWWIMEGWEGFLGRIFRAWYRHNSEWLAARIRKSPILKSTLYPFFKWAHSQGVLHGPQR